MLTSLVMPKFHEGASAALVESIHVDVNTKLFSNTKFIDVSINLSSLFAQNCPPISYYRIVLREGLWLRELFMSAGQLCGVGDTVAILSTDEREPLDQEVSRVVRIMTAGISYHGEMWSGAQA